jgi:competence protein ComEA
MMVPMPVARARALLVVLVALAALGALARRPRTGATPPPCPQPTRHGVVVSCDGDGGDLGGRAWLFARKLDVNAARAADLERIPGVGRRLAERIVAARAERGRFASLDELDDVDGVGPKLLERLGRFVEVR